MNIEYFYSFLEAVNQKSLSKASERLNISQPALSKQIRKVEDYFNTSLLSRTTSGVELTEAGKLVYNRLPIMLREVVAIQNDLNKLRNFKTYKVGTLPSLAGNYIPSRIVKLKEKGILAEVVVKNSSQEIYELLQNGQVDAAIIEELPVQKTFWKKELFTEPLVAVVHVSNELSKRKSVSLEEISDEEFVLYPTSCTIRKSLCERIKELKVKTEVEFGEFLIGYVAAGGGITVVPEITAKSTGHTMVRAVPICDFELNRRISFITQTKETGRLLYQYFT